MVALLAEGVDRNALIGADGNTYYVALLAEGVDRNLFVMFSPPIPSVALLAEGVDRNRETTKAAVIALASPSSQRAWIEIPSVGIEPPDHSRRPPRRGRG